MKYKVGFFAVFIASLFLAKAEASSHGPWESDIYKGPALPTPVTVGKVHFTVPALQGMERDDLTVEKIAGLVNPYLTNPSIRDIRKDNIVILLRRSIDGVEVSSVWQE